MGGPAPVCRTKLASPSLCIFPCWDCTGTSGRHSRRCGVGFFKDRLPYQQGGLQSRKHDEKMADIPPLWLIHPEFADLRLPFELLQTCSRTEIRKMVNQISHFIYVSNTLASLDGYNKDRMRAPIGTHRGR